MMTAAQKLHWMLSPKGTMISYDRIEYECVKVLLSDAFKRGTVADEVRYKIELYHRNKKLDPMNTYSTY